MAARVAASVVWLTPGAIMTLTSLISLLTALTAGLADFSSGFLVVTEAFDCTEAVFTLASDKFFFVGVTVALVACVSAARTAFGAGLALDFFADAANAAFAGEIAAFTAVAAALPGGLAAVVFLGTDRVTGVDLFAGLMAGLLSFAEGVGVFAVFFIAFAIESKPTELHSLRQSNHAVHAHSYRIDTNCPRNVPKSFVPCFQLCPCDSLFAVIRPMDRWFSCIFPHHGLYFAAELKP